MIQNLGQVSGIWVGLNPPNNTTLIWFNDNPGVQKHFVWDGTSWQSLQPNIIGTITYSDLAAQTGSLPVGTFYKLTTRKDGTPLPAGNEYLALCYGAKIKSTHSVKKIFQRHIV